MISSTKIVHTILEMEDVFMIQNTCPCPMEKVILSPIPSLGAVLILDMVELSIRLKEEILLSNDLHLILALVLKEEELFHFGAVEHVLRKITYIADVQAVLIPEHLIAMILLSAHITIIKDADISIIILLTTHILR